MLTMLQYGKPFGVGFGFFLLIVVIVMSIEIVKTTKRGLCGGWVLRRFTKIETQLNLKLNL